MATVTIRDLLIEYSSGGYAVRPIDGFDLDVGDGELVLLLGASGCGKTTLLSALAGILTPTRGSIVVDGTEVTTLSGRALTQYRRHGAGIVFQAFNLIPSLSAVENVALPMLAAGGKLRPSLERARSLVEQVDLADRGDHRPGDLSGGQQQRVAIARALALEPPLLVADEPTAHLDYIQVESVLGLLRALASKGRTVIIATHDDRLLALADHVVELSPRAIAAKGPTTVSLEDGEVLFLQGQQGDLIYLLDHGSIELTRDRDDGSVEVLDTVRPGSYFGELGPLFGLRRSATARARGAATVTGCSAAELRSSVGDAELNRLVAGHAH